MFFTLIWLLMLVLSMPFTRGSECGEKDIELTATSQKQIVTSPGYPSVYPSNAQCNWKITASLTDEVIRFHVVDSHLNSDFLCKEDYAELRDGQTAQARKIQRWCGDTVPSLVETTGRYGYLLMRTNHQHVAQGFSIEYWTVLKETTEYTTPTYTAVNYILFGVFAFCFLLISLSLLVISLIRLRKNFKSAVKQEAGTAANLRYVRPITAANTTVSTSHV